MSVFLLASHMLAFQEGLSSTPQMPPHLCTIPSPLRAPLKQIFSLAQPLTCNLWLRMVMKAFFDVGAVGTVVTCKGSELCCINGLQAHIL